MKKTFISLTSVSTAIATTKRRYNQIEKLKL